MELSGWKPPDDAPIPTTEFGWDAQLSSIEYDVLKHACTVIFHSIIERERDPYKRTILLGRIIQDSGVIVANAALKYSVSKMADQRAQEE